MEIQSIFILPISIGVQFIAGFLALRLITKETGGMAWFLIACALFLMGIRRSISFYHLLESGADNVASDAEFVALLISVFMLAGVALIGPLFAAMRHTKQKLQQAHKDMEEKVVDRTQELTDERDRANTYLNIAGAVIVALDDAGRVALINRKGCEILGYDRDDIIGKNWFNLAIPEDQRNIVKYVFEQGVNGEIDTVDRFENEIVTKAGDIRLVAWHNSVIKDQDGKITGIMSSGEDITERHKMEETLRRSEDRFDQSQQFANIGTWDWNIETGELYWSKQIGLLFGYQIGELETTYDNFIAAVHPDDREKVIESISACIEKGVEYDIEHRCIWPDGSVHFLQERGDVVRDGDGNPLNMLGVVQDITESKNMQAQLIQSSKMATLGEMATGVAHELNQPLNIISMASNSIIRKMRKGEANEEYLAGKVERINEQVKRASSIIDHMRIFGRKPNDTTEELDPKEIVQSVLGMIGQQLTLSGIEVVTNLPETCRPVLGDQVQMEQVVLNLLSNSRDAILNNDKINKKLITANITDDLEGDTIQIAIQDNGAGIEETILQHIFEPFYTTKEIGKGTGLGLSISYGIITDMGGTIEAQNIDDGCQLLISLPVKK